MNLLILAAGKSNRIFSKIKKHKCLLEIDNKTLLSKIIEDSISAQIDKVNIVTGFKEKILKKYIKKNHKNIKIINNNLFNKTDMLHSAILGLKKIKDDVIISYSDIIYDKKILNKIRKLKSKKILIPVKTDWSKVWKQRKKDIKDDAENLSIDKKNFLKTIGGKIKKKYPKGQYMGIIYIPKSMIHKILRVYKQNNIKKMQMSNFLNFLIKLNYKIKVINTKSYWYEFDDIQDYKNFFKK
jgi:L-glutamine-phosphate cytidylyltransferase